MPRVLESDFGFYDDDYIPNGDPSLLTNTHSTRMSGLMIRSIEYTNLSIGLTDRVLLIGHGDGLPLNDPHQVTDLRHTLRLLGSDTRSPLVRGLLEAYYGGARDIWVVSAAPMSDYVEDLEDRNKITTDGRTFYQRYHERLRMTYAVLETFDVFQIVVPLNAPMFGPTGVDFLKPFVRFCNDGFRRTGSVRMGLVGTELPSIGEAEVQMMLDDTRISELNKSEGKMVMNVIGSCIFSLREVPYNYPASPIASIAGALSSSRLDRGLTNRRVPNVSYLGSRQLKKAEIAALAKAKLNPVVGNTLSKRGSMHNVILATDNTMAEDGSDFWSIGQVRLISHVNEGIKALGHRYLGGTGMGSFKLDVEEYMMSLAANNVLRGFNLSINQGAPSEDNSYTMTAEVDVVLQPYFGLREIYFTSRIGPSGERPSVSRPLEQIAPAGPLPSAWPEDNVYGTAEYGASMYF